MRMPFQRKKLTMQDLSRNSLESLLLGSPLAKAREKAVLCEHVRARTETLGTVRLPDPALFAGMPVPVALRWARYFLTTPMPEASGTSGQVEAKCERWFVQETEFPRQTFLLAVASDEGVEAYRSGLFLIVFACGREKAQAIADRALGLWRSHEIMSLRAVIAVLEDAGLSVPDNLLTNLDDLEADGPTPWQYAFRVRSVGADSADKEQVRGHRLLNAEGHPLVVTRRAAPRTAVRSRHLPYGRGRAAPTQGGPRVSDRAGRRTLADP